MSILWATKSHAVSGLHLDMKNPRLGREAALLSPRGVINHLFEHGKAGDVAESIARGGYFPNEPLLGIKEGGRTVVVEGNRRLAALKALIDPRLVDGPWARRLERLVDEMGGTDEINAVPVTLAPSRRDTDRQIAGRHIGSPVIPWEAENRAGFVLSKLNEGYSVEQLKTQLGFNETDIQEARTTRAVADMARALPLSEAVKSKLNNPRAKVFSTIERVLTSRPGREFFKLEPSLEHGLKGKTSKASFSAAFGRLVSDIALNKQSSRSLNKADEIEAYLHSYDKALKPKKGGTFVPTDLYTSDVIAQDRIPDKEQLRSKPRLLTVLPRSLKVVHGNEKLADIRGELVRLKRSKFPNSGAFLLRAFFELSAVEYLRRTGELKALIAEQKQRGSLQGGAPTLKAMIPLLMAHAKARLTQQQANSVEKAIRYNDTVPFTVSDLHSFVHYPHELPTERDILQFWQRVEPLVRMMLERDLEKEA